MLYEEHFIQSDVWDITRNVTLCFGHTDERRRDNDDGQRHHTLAVTLELQASSPFKLTPHLLMCLSLCAACYVAVCVS